MDNRTYIRTFQILAFANSTEHYSLLFAVFFLIYTTGVLGNLVIISAVILDVRLHIPMYIFLCNLSLVDLVFTSSTLLKLMDILVTGNNSITFHQCFTQLYFFMFAAGTEDILLSCMAYDRYVAICRPLHYHHIMKKEKVILLLLGTMASGSLNSVFMTLSIYRFDFCRSNVIQNFFCDIKALEKISCNNTGFYIVLYIETLLLALCPFLLSVTSYVKIVQTVLGIKSTQGRRKAFSTCTSHLTVLLIFYGTGVCMYMSPPSEHLEVQDLVFSVLYTAVTPMLNPLIYSLRNKEVKGALKRIISVKI
ncbi:PREDICTED: olfactory receptor 1-like [Nanorana parkeri]|uniref:olfactory receptor 1-like n=1 Tax=Nanorana parkeri TaxID=125878 RepID=UPI00085423E0|nr:PREDICTED: olfactory receptor 1-like [Nanorana parkeri]